MLSVSLAVELKEAGLVWVSKLNDFFMIPDRGMDERLFVISDMMSSLELLRGWPVVTFHGAMEWALDYILTREVVWMPTEAQLREELIRLLPEPKLQLELAEVGYICRIHDGETHSFVAESGADAYAKALLHCLAQLENGNMDEIED